MEIASGLLLNSEGKSVRTRHQAFLAEREITVPE